jgi:hypothetical protein
MTIGDTPHPSIHIKLKSRRKEQQEYLYHDKDSMDCQIWGFGSMSGEGCLSRGYCVPRTILDRGNDWIQRNPLGRTGARLPKLFAVMVVLSLGLLVLAAAILGGLPSAYVPNAIMQPSKLLADPGDTSSITITSGTGFFKHVTSSVKSIDVMPATSVTGTVTMTTINTWASSAQMPLIGTASWGTHSSSYWTISNWIGTGTNSYVATVSISSPATPGTYYLVFAFRAETSGAYVASATNYAVGTPTWNDGNDIASFSASQISDAQSNGRTLNPWLMTGGVYQSLNVPADAIVINVGIDQGATSTVRITSGTGTFSSVSSSNKQISVVEGSSISGSLTMTCTNQWAGSAIVPLIWTPSWGSHSSSYVTAVVDIAAGSSTQTVSLTITASSPGTYYIIFAFRAETTGAYVASATNWPVGSPVWDDGNDIAGYSSAQISDAQNLGRTLDDWLFDLGKETVWVPSDAITINIVAIPEFSGLLVPLMGTVTLVLVAVYIADSRRK